MVDEFQTRIAIINRKLIAGGWEVVPYSSGILPSSPTAVTEYPTRSGPADYLLFASGKPLAVVEAKKASRDPYDSLTQAQRYSRDFSSSPFKFGEYQIPFIYSSNGCDIWFQDLRSAASRSRKIFHFHTPQSLLNLLECDDSSAREYLSNVPNDNYFLRYYQREAIEAVEKALLANKRRMLVAMATGTGKTFMAVSLIYRLIKSGMFKRILFLVDRRELGSQTVGAFANFEPESGLKFDKIYEVANIEESAIPKNAEVCVCTIQRMYSILKGKEMPEKIPESDDPWTWDLDDTPVEYNPSIPVDEFDCIISDECHRSIYNKWKIVLDYFDAVQIGLTATPAAHTYAYFDQNLVYSYPYEKAIQDGYLVDFDLASIKTGITIQGVTIASGQPLIARERSTGYQTAVFPEDELQFDTSQIERAITVIDRNRTIAEQVANYLKEDQKTLVFAVDDAHANQLVKLFRERYSHFGDRFVQKITYRVDNPLERIREFRNRKYPMIAVTVDMLSTGVDIPAIENLVFVRPVRSRILFEQMLGRGTRKCDEIGKTHFTVFDCVGVMEAFKEVSDFGKLYPEHQSKGIRDIVKELKMQWEVKENISALSKKLHRISKNISPEGVSEMQAYIPDGDLAAFASSLPERFKKDFKGALKLFENEGFIKLLESYPKLPRYFLIDELSRDEVIASEYLFHTLDGKNLKPEDYVKAFEKFVQENKDEISALRLLLEKPKEFKPQQLKELRRILATQPEEFTEQRLRRAYRHQLADIIAFVRHAALKEPLTAPQERIEQAFQHIYSKREFTPEQREWLELIKAHLVQNLHIEKEDFNDIPFSRRGGWKKANEVFNFKLEPLLAEINEVLA